MSTRGERRVTRRLVPLQRLWRCEHGTAAVEFAIVVPILLTLVFGIVDFGRALWTMNVATSALREGARMGAVQGTCAGSMTEASDRATAYLRSVLGPSASLPTVSAACSAATGLITVSYGNNEFPFTPIAPLVSRLGARRLSVRPAVFRWERAS